MARRLLYIATAVLGIVWSGISEAKVCRLGDPGCETNGFFGTGDGQCGDQYRPCDNPRAGATYCYGEWNGVAQALYRTEDCCSTLKEAPYNYQECLIEDGQTGYGLSCHGAADNITYWQQCGCTYGFVDTGDMANVVIDDVATGTEIPYETRCSASEYYIGNCKLGECNAERHFVLSADSGSMARCKYRLDTRCSAFGCMQVYDCNHDEIDTGKEYYRNDAEYLSPGKINFIPYLADDPYSNERRSDGSIKLISVRKDSSEGLTDNQHQLLYEDIDETILGVNYNVVNRYVCQYRDGKNNLTGADVGDNAYDDGFNCSSIENYCYLWQGCNNARRWYNSKSHARCKRSMGNRKGSNLC